MLIAKFILVGFLFRFCIVEPHQVYEAMIDGSIGIFAKARAALDSVIRAQ
jgi:hypothetical protein